MLIKYTSMKSCPKCQSDKIIKSGIIKGKQRYKCKQCNYHFTVDKKGKEIDPYYVVKALQLYLEGLSYREIEKLIGVSHVSVMNWVKKHNFKRVYDGNSQVFYRLMKEAELHNHLNSNLSELQDGMIISRIGQKYLLIYWEKLR